MYDMRIDTKILENKEVLFSNNVEEYENDNSFDD